MLTHTVVALSLLVAQVTDRLVTDPTELRATTRGARAVGFDPAAVSQADGAELDLRTTLVGVDAQPSFAAFAALPAGGLALGLGYEWLRLPELELRRATLALSMAPQAGLSFGLAYHELRRDDGGGRAGTWDFSLLAEPAAALSLGLGVEAANAPRLVGGRIERQWRVGVGLRPWRGERWLTLGAEARLRAEEGERVLGRERLLVDLAPLEGLHLLASYAPRDEELWLGVEVAAWGAALRGGGLTAASERGGAEGALAVGLRRVVGETLVAAPSRTIALELSGDLVPNAELFARASPISELPLELARLAAAPEVSRVILRIGDLDVGLGMIEELRAGIAALRAAGKEVVAELAGGSEPEYMVAAAADHIRLDPTTPLVLDGFSATLFFLAEGLGKLGVRFDAVSVGKYKTGADALTRSSARPEEREVLAGVLDLAARSFVAALSVDRKLDAAAVARIVASGVVQPEDALALGLVDELSQPTDPAELPRSAEPAEGPGSISPSRTRWGAPPVIAVVPLVGNITLAGGPGVLPGGAAAASELVRALEAARDDVAVRAVVLRIDSPGGEIYASELIWRAVRLLATRKPVVVSMGSVAASGGYYVAAAADVILAEPTTLTGSIGIFMLKPDLSGLLAQSGVNTETLATSSHADWSSFTTGLDAEELALVQRTLEVHYADFVERVAVGRKLPVERVRALAEGRVYTGEQALRLGLIDATGGLVDAVLEAKARAGLGEDAEVELRLPRGPRALGPAAALLRADAAPSLLAGLEGLSAALRSLATRPLARWPYEVVIE